MTCPTFLQKVGQSSVLVKFDTTMPHMVKTGLVSIHSNPWSPYFAYFCDPTNRFRDTDILAVNGILTWGRH